MIARKKMDPESRIDIIYEKWMVRAKGVEPS